jgi:hypothetical protein
LRQWGAACANGELMAPHWSANVVQSTLVLVFFIVVLKVLSGMVLSFVTQLLLLLVLTILQVLYSDNLLPLNLLAPMLANQKLEDFETLFRIIDNIQ